MKQFYSPAQFGIFWTVGEICSATSRLIIEEKVADRFYTKLKQMTETIVVGNPLNKDTRLGPVVNKSQYEKVLNFIEVGSLLLPPLKFPTTAGSWHHSCFRLLLLGIVQHRLKQTIYWQKYITPELITLCTHHAESKTRRLQAADRWRQTTRSRKGILCCPHYLHRR